MLRHFFCILIGISSRLIFAKLVSGGSYEELKKHSDGLGAFAKHGQLRLYF